ncbi:SPFH domain-containing protein [Eggerthellaceae bacterium zg-893]|nr:SPFH domain-containing protein [Eggerthellaceae bacterium zg-893]
MGLTKAFTGSVGGVLADQWRDYFYCDSLDANTLVARGTKRVSERSANTKSDPNIITNGSIIVVNEGQCMLIVEQGAVVEVCAEPGEFVFDASSEPSVFAGDLGEGIANSFATACRRFGFGGDTGRDQRVYFFNTKEIFGNKYGTAQPVPFRVIDANIGLDVDIAVRCNGEYSYRIVNPLLFYRNVCGNVPGSYVRKSLDGQLKSELLAALQPAFARISAQGVRYSAVPGYVSELMRILNEELSAQWREYRGIEIVRLGMNSITASEQDERMIKDLQRMAVMRDSSLASASLVAAQGEAMRLAAANENGALAGFMGLGLANIAGAASTQGLQGFTRSTSQPEPVVSPWNCSCGCSNTTNFCANCGRPRPDNNTTWQCGCGAVNSSGFCPHCGTPRPRCQGLG